MRGRSISLSAETDGQLEQRFVIAAGGGKLHASVFAGDGDDGNAGEAERGGVTQQAAAGLAVIRSGGKTGDGRGGEQKQVVLGEEVVHALSEGFVALAKGGDFIGRDAGAPLEAFADGGFEVFEVAGVDAGGFPGLDGGEDLE